MRREHADRRLGSPPAILSERQRRRALSRWENEGSASAGHLIAQPVALLSATDNTSGRAVELTLLPSSKDQA
jgi:hypothetical protein